MPLLSIARFFTSLLSLAILAGAGYLLWSWYDGELVRDAAGRLFREREAWRLATALTLFAWSFLGRTVMLPLLAKSDSRRTSARRGEGQTMASPTGSSLYVEPYGPVGAQPIIFTHGWGMDSTFWNYAKEDLGDRFRLILWDLPGLGKSRAVTGGVSLSAFAKDLSSLVEAAGPQRPVLVGHSIGGMTIQTLLRDQPELHRRLAGIVLLDTTYTNPLRTMILSRLLTALQKPLLEPAMRLTRVLHPLVWLMKWQSYLSGWTHLSMRLGFGRYVTRSQLEHVALLATRAPPRIEAAGNLAMVHWDATGALTDAPMPILVVGGDLDIVTKLEANRAIAAESDLARLHVVEGANHMGPMERADVYDQLIADFALHVQPSASVDTQPMADGRTGERKPDAPASNPPPPRH